MKFIKLPDELKNKLSKDNISFLSKIFRRTDISHYNTDMGKNIFYNSSPHLIHL
jgi:hypothetical protein